MARPTLRGCATSACSALACCMVAWGCSGLTIGPKVETRVIIVQPGLPVEILDSVVVSARVLRRDGDAPTDVFQQDIGGWVAMHPGHWDSLKREIARLRIIEAETKK